MNAMKVISHAGLAGRIALALLAVAAASLPGFAQDSSAKPADDKQPTAKQPTAKQPNDSADTSKPMSKEQIELETKFEESMRNVALVGFFTASDQPSGKLSEERYVIDKVVKDEGDKWMFHARIQYGKHDVPVRLKIPVKWAGDTPVISVTKLAVPLLGTFDARVLIYEGHYAGTWDGAGHGGQLFGRIEKNDKPEKNAQATESGKDDASK
ncbi:MAG: hypothetical protein WD875_13410 [Pirellulales bacterium]